MNEPTLDLTIKPEISKGIKELTEYAEKAEIVSGNDAEKAGMQLYAISELKKAVEDQRTEITKPLNLSLKSINAFFKKFSTPLEEIDEKIRAKVIEFGKTTEETAFGVIHFRKNLLIEVIDKGKVPEEYLIPDMAKIKEAIREGKDIPGVQITEEKIVSL